MTRTHRAEQLLPSHEKDDHTAALEVVSFFDNELGTHSALRFVRAVHGQEALPEHAETAARLLGMTRLSLLTLIADALVNHPRLTLDGYTKRLDAARSGVEQEPLSVWDRHQDEVRMSLLLAGALQLIKTSGGARSTYGLKHDAENLPAFGYYVPNGAMILACLLTDVPLDLHYFNPLVNVSRRALSLRELQALWLETFRGNEWEWGTPAAEQ